MSSKVNCSTCAHALWDAIWGEFKCKQHQRTCTNSEIVMGCDDYKKPGTQPKEKPEVIVRSGATFIPNINPETGVISWTNDKGLPNPSPVSIKGKDGVNGKDGKAPVKGVDYFTDADKADMVSAVVAALPVYNGEVQEL